MGCAQKSLLLIFLRYPGQTPMVLRASHCSEPYRTAAPVPQGTLPTPELSFQRLAGTQLFSLAGRGDITAATSFRLPLMGTTPWAKGAAVIWSCFCGPQRSTGCWQAAHHTCRVWFRFRVEVHWSHLPLTSQKDAVIHQGRHASLFQKYTQKGRTDEGTWKGCTYIFPMTKLQPVL